MKKSELRQIIREEFKKINEGSPISDERMIRSLYDKMKIRNLSGYAFSFNKSKKLIEFDFKNRTPNGEVNITGSITTDNGVVRIKFNEFVMPASNYTVKWVGDEVLTKDGTSDQVFNILRRKRIY